MATFGDKFKAMMEFSATINVALKNAKDKGIGYEALLSALCAGIDTTCDLYGLDHLEIHKKCYEIAKEIHNEKM